MSRTQRPVEAAERDAALLGGSTLASPVALDPPGRRGELQESGVREALTRSITQICDTSPAVSVTEHSVKDERSALEPPKPSQESQAVGTAHQDKDSGSTQLGEVDEPSRRSGGYARTGDRIPPKIRRRKSGHHASR